MKACLLSPTPQAAFGGPPAFPACSDCALPMHQEFEDDKRSALLMIIQGFMASVGQVALECRGVHCSRRMFAHKLRVGASCGALPHSTCTSVWARCTAACEALWAMMMACSMHAEESGSSWRIWEATRSETPGLPTRHVRFAPACCGRDQTSAMHGATGCCGSVQVQCELAGL